MYSRYNRILRLKHFDVKSKCFRSERVERVDTKRRGTVTDADTEGTC